MNNCLILEYAKNIETELLLKYDIKIHLIQIIYYISQYFSPPIDIIICPNRKLIESYYLSF